MPGRDQYEELIVTSLILIGALLLIVVMVVGIMLFYQKKKFQHRQMIADLEKRFSEALLKSQLEIQEETFNRISQEIHDNVGQMLSLAKVQISIMTESKDWKGEALEEVKQNIGKAMNDLRDIAKSLSSDRIRTLSVHGAVCTEAERINRSGVLFVKVEIAGRERDIVENKKLILFRIIQESMQNIIKHSGASEALIRFDYNDRELTTCIQDNGKGFQIGEPMMDSVGLGLSNIRTRAILAGGNSTIESKPNFGTAVKIDMPYE